MKSCSLLSFVAGTSSACAFYSSNVDQPIMIQSTSHGCNRLFGPEKRRVNSKPLSVMKCRVSFSSKNVGVTIIMLSLAFGLSAFPGWMETIERGWQVHMIDQQVTGEGVQEAIGILRRKFALLPISEIDARLKSVSTESQKTTISDVLQRLGDKYSRIASHQELSSLLNFDPSGLGVVLRQGQDGGIYLSHAGRREDVRDDMRIVSIAGYAVSNLYDAAELLVQHEKPLEFILEGKSYGIKEDDSTRIMMDIDDEFKRGGSVHATMLRQGSRSIGYIRIKQFDAFVGDEVPVPHMPQESRSRRAAQGICMSVGGLCATRDVLPRAAWRARGASSTRQSRDGHQHPQHP
jgi:hypothetical protein